MKIIDLHTHTTKSDGSLHPDELVRYAKRNKLTAVAITDHDTVNGVEEALYEGARIGMEVVAGVEISVDYKTEMHILGYFTKHDYVDLEYTLEDLRRYRSERNPRIVKKLNEIGMCVTMEEVREKAGEKMVGRPHIAKVLVEKGYVNDISDAFEKYLKRGKPAYFKKEKLLPEDGIKAIIKAGGIPVLAHPVHLQLKYELLNKLLGELKEYGLRGLEAYYTDNTSEDDKMLLKLASENNLLVTGGSDYHGNLKDSIDIGSGYGNLRVPYELLDILKREFKT